MSAFNEKFLSSTGICPPADAFFVVVRTLWNDSICSGLLEGCTRVLDEHKLGYRVVDVPGAFEIPFAIRHLWEKSTPKPAAFIALGCVIRGDTPHFDYVCRAVTDGILNLNLSLPVPSIFGILTVDNLRQAEERIGGAHGHKGEEAALTAIQMVAGLG